MTSRVFTYRSRFDVPVEALARWHEQPGSFEKLLPPWQKVTVLEAPGDVRDGTRVRLRVFVGPFPFLWELEHQGYLPGRQFQDRQIRGRLFAEWLHTHRFEPDGGDGSVLEDEIRYRLPLGRLGDLVADRLVRRQLTRLFEYRHAVVRRELMVGFRRGARELPGR